VRAPQKIQKWSIIRLLWYTRTYFYVSRRASQTSRGTVYVLLSLSHAQYDSLGTIPALSCIVIVIVIVIGGLKSDGLTSPYVGTEKSYPA